MSGGCACLAANRDLRPDCVDWVKYHRRATAAPAGCLCDLGLQVQGLGLAEEQECKGQLRCGSASVGGFPSLDLSAHFGRTKVGCFAFGSQHLCQFIGAPV